MNWNTEAARLAVDVQEQLYTVLRGAVNWYQPGIAVAFGNDGYEQDERTERQVRWLRETLPHFNSPVLGFGVSDDGFTWVLIVRTSNVEWLNAVVWRAWREASHGAQPVVPGADGPPPDRLAELARHRLVTRPTCRRPPAPAIHRPAGRT
jgi:hypothetical protein